MPNLRQSYLANDQKWETVSPENYKTGSSSSFGFKKMKSVCFSDNKFAIVVTRDMENKVCLLILLIHQFLSWRFYFCIKCLLRFFLDGTCLLIAETQMAYYPLTGKMSVRMICDFVAGWVSGMVGFAVGHPIDTIKVQQQVKEWNSPSAAAKHIYRAKGLRGFYRGMMFPFLTNGILNAIFFGAYGPLCDLMVYKRLAKEDELQFDGKLHVHPVPRHQVHDHEGHEHEDHRNAYFRPRTGVSSSKSLLNKVENVEATYLEMFNAGCLAGLVQLCFSVPIELVKVKLQSKIRQRVFAGPVDCFKTVYRTTGVRGLYRGAAAMAIRNLAGAAMHFTVLYHLLRGILSPDSFQYREKLHFWSEVLPAAGVAGMVSWWIVMPFDVIKSKMQADNHLNPTYRNMMHCGRSIVKNQGVRGLFVGFWSASLRAFPVNASSFVAYQFFQGECKIFKKKVKEVKTSIEHPPKKGS